MTHPDGPRLGPAAVWALVGFLESGAVDGVIAAVLTPFLHTGPWGGSRILVVLGVGIYSTFWWLLLGIVTVPVLMLGTTGWALFTRRYDHLERSLGALILGVCFLALAVVFAKGVLLGDLRPLRGWRGVHGFPFKEWLSLSVGMTLPRLTSRGLRLGVFKR